ncbi:MAG TPA: lanthionine synthetase LanC family protein [Pirellulales bacterium]
MKLSEPGLKVSKDELLDAAAEIGHCLVRDAIRHDGKMTWISTKDSPTIAPWQKAIGTVGGDFYSGTSGIGYFLAVLARKTGDRQFRRAAIESLEYAESLRSSGKMKSEPSFYCGLLGLAMAWTQLFLASQLDFVFGRVRSLWGQIARTAPLCESWDVISGTAGIIPFMALIGEFVGDRSTVELINSSGMLLINAAEHCENGCSWRARGGVGRNLTGFAHGASGVAAALLCAFEATGERVFSEHAVRAMDYEAFAFDNRLQNWRDFRTSSSKSTDSGQFSCANAWCHGAPGIAIARHHAMRHLGGDRWDAECKTAIETTAKSTLTLLNARDFNFSLCHGLCGNAEIASYCAAGQEQAERVANLVPRVLKEHYLEFGARIPCGSYSLYESPGFMLGLAGIGHFLLRQSSPEDVESIICN